MGQKSAPLPCFEGVQQQEENFRARIFSARVIRVVAKVWLCEKKIGGFLALSSCDITVFSARKIRSII